MRAIAARLGISVTNIYQHYENKAAIVREVRFHGVAMLSQALLEAGRHDDRAVRLGEMSDAYLRFACSNAWLYRQLFDAEELDWTSMPDDERALALSPIAITRDNFAEGLASGAFRSDLDVDQAVLLTWASLHGVASLLLNGRLSPSHPAFPVSDVGVFVTSFVENLVAGFRR